jgi:dTDP-4-amino-4,6-dideoxygalactose transaminase
VAQVCGRKYVFLTSSGTVAIYLILRALQIEGEVIFPAIVCPTVYYAVRAAGAMPVLADVSLQDFNIDPQSVSRLLSPKTEAIISVNLFGYPAMTEEIAQLVGSTDVLLIEDAAQSIGGTRFGRPLGSWGDVSILSFASSKIIRAGGGGAILTDNKAIANAVGSELEAVRSNIELLAEIKHDISEYVIHDFMDQYEKTRTRWADLMVERARFVFRWLFSGQMKQGHVIRALHCLSDLPEMVIRRAVNAEIYRTRLVHPDISHPAYVEGHGVVWRYSVLVRDQDQQERVLRRINENGIVASRHYPPLHWQFPDSAPVNGLPASEQIGNRIINLPVSPDTPQSLIASLCDLFLKALTQET